jgi:hypothetical protein
VKNSQNNNTLVGVVEINYEKYKSMLNENFINLMRNAVYNKEKAEMLMHTIQRLGEYWKQFIIDLDSKAISSSKKQKQSSSDTPGTHVLILNIKCRFI